MSHAPGGSILLLPKLARCFPRSFIFYVALPIHSIETRLLPTLTHVLPSI
jgi:hypothetical protein